MYRLTISIEDRINFDQAAFAWADECIRSSELPVWELDIEEFAREHFALEREWLEESVDDIEEAEARYIEAFRKAHRYALSAQEC